MKLIHVKITESALSTPMGSTAYVLKDTKGKYVKVRSTKTNQSVACRGNSYHWWTISSWVLLSSIVQNKFSKANLTLYNEDATSIFNERQCNTFQTFTAVYWNTFYQVHDGTALYHLDKYHDLNLMFGYGSLFTLAIPRPDESRFNQVVLNWCG